MFNFDFKELASKGHWFYGPSPLSNHPTLGPFTYFIQSGETIKIGSSATPELRVDQLRRGGKAHRPTTGLNPEIRLLAYTRGGQELEKLLHARFAASHDRGEWFFITDELIALVNETIAEQARMEVAVHDAYYQDAVVTHDWPAAVFDHVSLIQKRIHCLTTDEQWEEIEWDSLTTQAA